ncbi:SagB/ThcOx family dehydrogenase [Kaarinaea lacus]
MVSNHTKTIESIRRYHQQTKHRLERYANGPETLDWSMQPDPFRRFEGASTVELPLNALALEVGYDELYENDKIKASPLNLKSIGTLMELSMGLSAWKEYQGDRWALRCNPSSGNLHPTEAYIIADGIDDLESGVYHYVSYDHTLEQRCRFNINNGVIVESQNDACLMVGLSSVLWREAWKYGERAYRYCQLDIGHALASIRYSCALLGWKAEVIPNVDDDSIEQLLGTNRDQDFGDAEREHPDLLLKIFPSEPIIDNNLIEELIQYTQQGKWSGTANLLDKRHLYDWPIIDEIALASRARENPEILQWSPTEHLPPLALKTKLYAKDVIQRRRSAQRFDGITTVEKNEFLRMLDMLIPRRDTPPWDAISWQPRIHLVLFIHRVNGLEPGLYILVRNDSAIDSLKANLSDKMEWLPIEKTPDHLNFYRLVKANAKNASATLSCHQRIASDGAFSLGMLSEFDTTLETSPCAYKHLYWEAGILGQVLYLEAEAIDLQGTGIGCYFDDAFHEMLGITGTQFQSVYHFTVGGALNDSRLRTILPYEHIRRD